MPHQYILFLLRFCSQQYTYYIKGYISLAKQRIRLWTTPSLRQFFVLKYLYGDTYRIPRFCTGMFHESNNFFGYRSNRLGPEYPESADHVHHALHNSPVSRLAGIKASLLRSRTDVLLYRWFEGHSRPSVPVSAISQAAAQNCFWKLRQVFSPYGDLQTRSVLTQTLLAL